MSEPVVVLTEFDGELEKFDYLFMITLNDKYDGFRIERQMNNDEALEFYKTLKLAWPNAKIDAVAFPLKRGHMMSDIWKEMGLL